MKIRIRNKLLITICFLIVLSLAGQIVFNLFFSKGFFMKKQERIIAQAFEQIRTGYSEDLDAVNEIAGKLQNTYGVKTEIFDKTEMIYSSGYSYMRKEQHHGVNPAFHNTEFTASPNVVLIKGKGPAENDHLQLAGSFEYGGKELRVLMTLQITAIDNSISVFTEANIYLSVLVIVLGVLIARVVSGTISRPIMRVEAVSRRIADLDFSCEADESDSTVELASLAQSVNQMSRQLEQNMRKLTDANEQLQKDIEYKRRVEGYRRDFIAAVSHEMKTPLALLQIYTENLKNNIAGIDRDYYCDTILEETGKLSRMVSAMLETASIEKGVLALDPEDLDLSELCQEILQEYHPILKDYSTTIELAENAFVLGDRKYMEQVIKNILNNALQHTEAGNLIRVKLEKEAKAAVLSVYNQGEAIPAEDMEHLWDAFYRIDKARTRNDRNNAGLGLYIVKTVIDKLGGSCRIENTEGGVTVTISLEEKDRGKEKGSVCCSHFPDKNII